jgi:hypothetical protein
MGAHLELLTESVEATAEVVSDTRDLEAQQLSDLALGPSQPVDQDDHDPLALRETSERVVEARLDIGKFIRADRGQHDWSALSPGVVTGDAIDVAGPVVHGSDAFPVLPRIRQPFRE